MDLGPELRNEGAMTNRMSFVRSYRSAALLAAFTAMTIAVVAIVSVAEAGKAGRNQVVKDSKDTGKLYDAKTYKACDITEVKAQVKRAKLIVKVTLRAKQSFPNTYLNLNTSGGNSSDPEWIASPGNVAENTGSLTKTGGVDKFGNNKKPKFIPDATKLKSKRGGKDIQYEVPLRKIGKPKKTGFQAQTCGEGAVDLAPGGNHFDDVSWSGRPDYKFKNIKTGN